MEQRHLTEKNTAHQQRQLATLLQLGTHEKAPDSTTSLSQISPNTPGKRGKKEIEAEEGDTIDTMGEGEGGEEHGTDPMGEEEGGEEHTTNTMGEGWREEEAWQRGNYLEEEHKQSLGDHNKIIPETNRRYMKSSTPQATAELFQRFWSPLI